MHLFFKHMAFRIWITASVGIPLAFIWIPKASPVMPPASPPMIYSLLICLVFVLTGSGMHFLAVQCIKGFVREAHKWERSARPDRCETALLKALAVYNTGFIIPWRKKKAIKKLTGTMARFALAHDRNTSVFIKATKYFLKKFPHETDVATQWLKKDAFFSLHDPEDASLLSLLARTHRDCYPLLPLLAHRFLVCQRCDFEARCLYEACLDSHVLCAATRQKILELFPDDAFPINALPNNGFLGNSPEPGRTLGHFK
ncbi:hypothetical protein [Desulfocicer niacini]